MKRLLLLVFSLWALLANGQDYLINFTGTKNPVEIVIVENLATGETLTLNGTDVLNLKGSSILTGINDNHVSSGMKIYPNPVNNNNNTSVEIYPPASGDAVISIFDMSGKQLVMMNNYLDNSKQEFRISNLSKGFFVINVRGSNFQLSGKIICSTNSGGQLSIEKISSDLTVNAKEIKSVRGNQIQGIIDMLYSPGNRLKFTAISGTYRTTITDIPDQTKTMDFDLVAIVDKDNNNYHSVEIGDQIWMEENMKTTSYKDGASIPLVSDNNLWSSLKTPGYSWYEQNKATYKDTYGALYNGYTIGTGKICPTGWHVPTLEEFRSMTDYLTINNFGYHGDQSAIAKSLASKSGWMVPQPVPYKNIFLPVPDGAVGKNPQDNNGSGFNGYAGGLRSFDGSFSGAGYTAAWYSSSGTTSLTDFSMTYGANGDGVGLQQGDDLLPAGLSVRCIKGDTKTLPNLITTHAYNITQTSASSGASTAGEGEAPITQRGVCWTISGNNYPTIADSKTTDGTGSGSFISTLTGLLPGTNYYVRSYAINSDGIAYGTLDEFTTLQ